MLQHSNRNQRITQGQPRGSQKPRLPIHNNRRRGRLEDRQPMPMIILIEVHEAMLADSGSNPRLLGFHVRWLVLVLLTNELGE